MRLLLTHGYFLEDDPKEREIMKPYAPLGLLYLSSHLKARGIAVEVYDSTFGSRGELFRLLEDGPPGVLGIYGTLMTRAGVLAIVAAGRAAGWRVVLGGPEPVNYAEEYLNAGAEAIVAGEGEHALESLMAGGMDRAAWASIPGIVFRDSAGAVRRTGPAKLIGNLDGQPWPDREAIDIGRYLSAWRARHGVGSVSLITARGCPYHCNWCSHSVYGKTHRRRSPAGVAEEVEFLLGRYSPDLLWMADDVFTIHHGWLFDYANQMRSRGLRVPFECITRADRVNERVAATLAELGCFRVWIGSESGSQRVLDRMERGVTLEQVRHAVRLLKANGIATGMFLMWGYDGEEGEDILATAEHVRECAPDVFFTTVSYPIKGTPYYERVENSLVRIGPWEQTTDREIRIRGRHSREFYRKADELLRSATAESRDAARSALFALQAEVEA
jgi:anaerobic magnesium-protoporphyrin IX monomethyl ester cyclase